MVGRSCGLLLNSFTPREFLSLDFNNNKKILMNLEIGRDVCVLHEYNEGDPPCSCVVCNNSSSYTRSTTSLYLQWEWCCYLCLPDCNAEPNQYESRESGHCDDTRSNTAVHHRTWRGGEPNRSGIFCKYIQWNRYLDAYRIATGILYFNWFSPFSEKVWGKTVVRIVTIFLVSVFCVL